MSPYMQWWGDFVVQTLAGVVGVFVGVWLALVFERRRHEEDTRSREAKQENDFDRALDTVLGSVVKNTAEAKRILRLLAAKNGPGLIHSALETSEWYAIQGQFVTLCRNVDERVMFAQFFDNVRRLHAFVEFRSNLQISIMTSKLDPADPESRILADNADQHLAALAEDLRFSGVLLITDHGKPVHKRLIGVRPDPPETVAGLREKS